MTTTISSKGQIVLPAGLRKRDRIRPGERFDVERLGSGKYLLKKVKAARPSGVLEWLRACPERGWFRALPPETTDRI
jgi:AbrB family looped-hinge helix DNA binding protein